ncbi:5-formyltetrahydrofolate cyclo-ligase [Gayadomonas joobiniege]|uniref:5-formyltetrahydrofolate cyclo-ligase n=1 Tax=Gayadomonas joobiniege TaxID=1234606 RepID=UPI000377D182|nr:5-formyltetrahydrofolate cyclo-ligase [Gayadomonas joobiniege]
MIFYTHLFAMNKQAIRQSIRQKRNQLSAHAQQIAATAIVRQANEHLLLNKVSSAAFYLANDGELNAMPLLQSAQSLGIKTYLPVLHPFAKGHLAFYRYQTNNQMTVNRYGIPEPVLDARHVCPVNQLDIIFLPLVGFDKMGNRMGMGGGFYDRTLSVSPPGTPKLIGLAHQCQEVEALPVESWDIPLHGILTPEQFIRC